MQMYVTSRSTSIVAKKVQPPSPELREAPLSIRIKRSVNVSTSIKQRNADRRSVSARWPKCCSKKSLKAKGF